MSNLLREPLSTEQTHLINVMHGYFAQSGVWPIWQYVDLTLDARWGLDAADVLASLPAVGERSPASLDYGLVWRTDPHLQPRAETQVAVTVAGLSHVPEAEPLLGAFLTTIRFLVEQQRRLVPSPDKVVEATVTRAAIEDQIATATHQGLFPYPGDMALGKLRRLLVHEPFMHAAVQPFDQTAENWTVRVPAVLRAYRGIAIIDDYLDRVIDQIAPPGEPPVPPSFGALDVPYAIGYLDAVWKNQTGCHLFVDLDSASIARLTQDCADQEDFNSLMSALADVLAQVVVPGQATPPQKAALEDAGKYLASSLEADAAARVSSAVETLIHLRRVRVGAQHGDARHKAVAAFHAIGLAFPPPSWQQAWAHMAGQAKGALDIIREEVHAGLRMQP